MNDSRPASSKAKILSQIRNSQQATRLPKINQGTSAGLQQDFRPETDPLQRLLEELDVLGVSCYLEETEDGVQRQIQKLTKDKSILSWDAEQLPYDMGAILQRGKVCFEHDDMSFQAAADLGLTGCDAAIAETGSLVLCSGEGKPRTASLLPFEHLALLSRKDILLSMGEFFSKKVKEVSRSSCLNIVTGPSRTADIELSLTLGVHGPGKVMVVIGP